MKATPTFRDKGFAALRRSDDGNLILDRGLRVSKPQAVRVRVQKDNEIVGSSKPPYPKIQPGDPFEVHIRRARDTLYEEELFHEINREARLLLQHGIETRSNLVQFNVDDNQHILLDLIALDEWHSDREANTNVQDTLAETVAQSLRILLSHAHRLNLRRRTQIPPPLTSKRRPNPEYSLLRPPACYLQHRSEMKKLCSFLDNLIKPLRIAQVECNYVANAFTAISTSRKPSQNVPTNTKVAAVEELVTRFTSPLESVISGSLVSPLSSFRIRINTNINPNGFGTEFELLTTLTHLPRFQYPQRFGLQQDLQDRLIFLFTLDVMHIIPSLAGDLTQPITMSPDRESDPNQQNQDDDYNDSTLDVSTPSSDIYLAPWESTFPNMSELTAYSPRHSRNKKLTIDLFPNQLLLRSFWAGDELNAENPGDFTIPSSEPSARGVIVYTWRGSATGSEADGSSGAREAKSLKEVVRLASCDNERT